MLGRWIETPPFTLPGAAALGEPGGASLGGGGGGEDGGEGGGEGSRGAFLRFFIKGLPRRLSSFLT